jgi:hypothetical protein
MKPFLLLNGLRGIYVPQRFSVYGGVSGLNAADFAILRAGPDNPDYWEVWDWALRFARITIEGTCCYLHQSDEGDLWAIPPNWEVDWDGSFVSSTEANRAQ